MSRLDDDSLGKVRDLVQKHGVAISGLGYYPNPLHPDADHRRRVVEHLKQVIRAAGRLGVGIVNTFIGRDPQAVGRRQLADAAADLARHRAACREVRRHARHRKLSDALQPRRMARRLQPGRVAGHLAAALRDAAEQALGLNFDPSHLIWQHIDHVRCIRDFGKRIVHVHAKDTRIDADKLYAHGILGLGWHTAKLPGLGDVDWGQFFSALTDTGYKGPVCIEVEDRAYEGSVADRLRALRQSKRYLEQFV